MLFPECFPSLDDFLAWRASALRAKERATPCDDCTAKYRQQMGTSCHKEHTEYVFVVHEYNTKPTNEI